MQAGGGHLAAAASAAAWAAAVAVNCQSDRIALHRMQANHDAQLHCQGRATGTLPCQNQLLGLRPPQAAPLGLRALRTKCFQNQGSDRGCAGARGLQVGPVLGPLRGRSRCTQANK